MTKFWELEETSTKRHMSEEDTKCELFYEQTVSRDTNGRLHVRLPLKVECVSFGETQRFAVQRQLQIERRFKVNAKYAEMYRAFMLEYEMLGHMRKIDGEAVDMTRTKAMQTAQHNVYYIPHHAVQKESSTTTKLRVVFDASRRSTNGVSLNDVMMTGPRLQNNLTATMMRWRTYRLAYCADVQRMYRQIVVDRPDASMQRIVWRASSDDPMCVYELTTVTYGTASAPYLAIKSLQTLAEMERERFPVGADIALRNFYVDDVLCGGDDEEDCVRGQLEIIGLLESGGMSLRKWASNSEFVLSQVEEAHRECKLPLDLHDDAAISTLGIQWHPSLDTLGFKVDVVCEASGWTKKNFLSAASRLFDPLGWLAPCIIRVKILFQSLWKLKLEWEDPLPTNLAHRWDEMREQMQQLKEIRIDRWIGSVRGSAVELHGFCDASLDAYGAVVFARVCDASGNVHVHNLCAKSKVAPVKVVSLPRLELCGAALLVKLLGDVKQAMIWENVEVCCWCDSTIVLSWLNAHASEFTVFVANRTAEIQRNVAAEHWRHVPSEDNPADCVSRGITANQLLTHTLWWSGPAWLRGERSEWPTQPTVRPATDERRVRANHLTVDATNGLELPSRVSSLRRLIRVTAWCARFYRNCRTTDRAQRVSGPLTPAEHLQARDVWVRAAQSGAFPDELRHVRNGEAVSKSSTLRALNPVITPDGILRVGGRLVNARELTDAARCPAIIPRRSDLSRLLVQDAHERTLHGGPMLMLAYIRRQFWLIDGPNEVRNHVRKCATCFRHTAKPTTQLMGALPPARVMPSRPFAHCALDYSGAILVRSAKGRGHHATKAYVAVFVCLATKAVHVELAGDLTTAAFIAAYERFTARRGLCTDLYSDNATNFVGASAIFVRTEREIFGAEVLAALATRGTKWHFSPPLSPHFNGLAESAIRSVKHHLKRVVGEVTLTFEELTTVLAKIEAVLNSRPIYPLSSDPSDFEALTPAHFLIGEPTGVLPQRDCSNDKIPVLLRWELTKQMVQRFWRRWSADYLHTLQQRRKWQRPQDELAVDDMVLLLDDNLPPGKWSLGRVVQTHPGDDGHVRVATVRTKAGVFKRAVVRMAKLPNQARTATSTDETV